MPKGPPALQYRGSLKSGRRAPRRLSDGARPALPGPSSQWTGAAAREAPALRLPSASVLCACPGGERSAQNTVTLGVSPKRSWRGKLPVSALPESRDPGPEAPPPTVLIPRRGGGWGGAHRGSERGSPRPGGRSGLRHRHQGRSQAPLGCLPGRWRWGLGGMGGQPCSGFAPPSVAENPQCPPCTVLAQTGAEVSRARRVKAGLKGHGAGFRLRGDRGTEPGTGGWLSGLRCGCGSGRGPDAWPRRHVEATVPAGSQGAADA